MGFIKLLWKKFGGGKKTESDPFADEMAETLKAYKVRGDMIEKYKSITAYWDHREEYEQRLATEPVPSWDHYELIVGRLQVLAALYPPEPSRFTSKWKERLDKVKEADDAGT